MYSGIRYKTCSQKHICYIKTTLIIFPLLDFIKVTTIGEYYESFKDSLSLLLQFAFIKPFTNSKTSAVLLIQIVRKPLQNHCT